MVLPSFSRCLCFCPFLVRFFSTAAAAAAAVADAPCTGNPPIPSSVPIQACVEAAVSLFVVYMQYNLWMLILMFCLLGIEWFVLIGKKKKKEKKRKGKKREQEKVELRWKSKGVCSFCSRMKAGPAAIAGFFA